MQTTIVKWGNSQGVRLPKLLLDSVNLADNDAVEVRAVDDKIIITKANRHKTLAERLEGWDGTYALSDEDREWLDMSPVGEEI